MSRVTAGRLSSRLEKLERFTVDTQAEKCLVVFPWDTQPSESELEKFPGLVVRVEFIDPETGKPVTK